MPEPGWHLPYMTSGERVLWQTEPEKRRLTFLPIALLCVLLLAALCIPAGMCLYGLLLRTGSLHGPATVCSIAGAVWLGLAACQALIPWMLRQAGRRHPEYVLTDRRILRSRGGLVDSLLLHQLPEPTLMQEKDGTSTLLFWPAAAHNPEVDAGRANLGGMLGFCIRNTPHGHHICGALRQARVRHERPRPIFDTPLIPLEPGESLLWQGSPTRKRPLANLLSGRYITGESGGWFFWAWGLVISVGFSALVLSEIGWQGDIWPMYAMLAAMAALCGGMLARPLLRQTRMPRNTAYVLTDRRLIRRIDGHESEIRLDREAGTPIYLACGRSGTATLMLCSLPRQTASLSDAAAVMEGFQLTDVPDAARVADLIAAITALRKEPDHDES